MPVNINKVEDPCQACRERHLKCDDGIKCRQCERLGQECKRENGKHKFRWGSSARYDQHFAKDQVWLAQSKNAKLQFVDQGPELQNFYSTEDSDQDDSENGPLRSTKNKGDTIYTIPSILDTSHSPPHTHSPANSDSAIISPAAYSISSILGASTQKRRKTNESSPQAIELRPRSSDHDPHRFYVVREPPRNLGPFGSNVVSSPTDSQNELKKVYAEYERLGDTFAAEVPTEELLSPAVWKKHFIWPNEVTTTQCACLMRYYTDFLGPWLDIGDPARHFTLVVPQKARRCPPLLNAIFTVAARHIVCLPQYKNADGVVQYQNNLMPHLNDRQAIKYQNASIAYLKELCKTPEHVQDEDLLAATVILRYFEELESSLGADHHETVMRPLQLFIAAQADQSFLSQPTSALLDFSMPGSFSSVRADAECYLKSYQHASFRIALRQECARAFMKQKPIGLPLQGWSVLQGFDEAEDVVWSDRHLYHLAHVLQYCFDESQQGQWSPGRWYELKNFEQHWENNKPISFAAIHYKEPNFVAGEALPEIWYLADIHAIATQYFNLSRILLTVYNPTLPKLGPGVASAARRTSSEVRQLVKEICGIARSMSRSEPALVQAYMAIALCGEHFTNAVEQDALMQILSDLQNRYGFPTSATADDLGQAWNRAI